MDDGQCRQEFGTGNRRKPTLELVGCYAWSAGEVGHDVGELCGIDPLDVKATNDIGALIALRPDCVVYNPMFADVDELVNLARLELAEGLKILAHRLPYARRAGPAPWQPMHGMSGPTNLPVEFGRPLTRSCAEVVHG